MSFRIPLPAGKYHLTQGFGGNADYYRQFGQKGHNGRDYGADPGTPVYAADEGTVAYEGWGQNHSWMGSPAGICILINHIGSYAGYAHLSKTTVDKGQKVKKGQLIGYVGATGAATGSHLHFEMLPLKPNFNNGFAGRIDITPYIDQKKLATEAEIKKAYLDILERPADAAGVRHYKQYQLDFVRQDLQNSAEKRRLEANKAAAAKAEAERKAQEAKKAAERKKAEEAAKEAQAELDRIAAEEEAARKAAEAKAKSMEDIAKANNDLLKQILAIVQQILEKLTNVFK